jgi:hypothetical protein
MKKEITSEPFWQGSLPHESFDMTGEEHAVKYTSLPERV